MKTKNALRKQLRVLAGRTEANVTALRISVECLDPQHTDLCEWALELQDLMGRIRQEIESMED